jgi:hypothetical protein
MRIRSSSVSTYSATVSMPIVCASWAIARTMASVRGLLAESRTKLPSIFSVVTGSDLRYVSDERPVPKSSSANVQPSARMRCIRRSARARLDTAAVSVSSKQIELGGSPDLRSADSRYVRKSSSAIDGPDTLIEKRVARPCSILACGRSAARAFLITHLSIWGSIW